MKKMIMKVNKKIRMIKKLKKKLKFYNKLIKIHFYQKIKLLN